MPHVDLSLVFVSRTDPDDVVLMTGMRTSSNGTEHVMFDKLTLIDGKIPRNYEAGSVGWCRTGTPTNMVLAEFDAAYAPWDTAQYAHTGDSQ